MLQLSFDDFIDNSFSDPTSATSSDIQSNLLIETPAILEDLTESNENSGDADENNVNYLPRSPAYFLRYGRQSVPPPASASFLRFGRSNPAFLRFGRGSTNAGGFLRFGRQAASTGSNSNAFLRFGRKAEFLRFE